jgi:hypothetical protein
VSAVTASVEVVCLGIFVTDGLARPVDAVPAWGSPALVDEIALADSAA